VSGYTTACYTGSPETFGWMNWVPIQYPTMEINENICRVPPLRVDLITRLRLSSSRSDQNIGRRVVSICHLLVSTLWPN